VIALVITVTDVEVNRFSDAGMARPGVAESVRAELNSAAIYMPGNLQLSKDLSNETTCGSRSIPE
jgi:hypothetical protein